MADIQPLVVEDGQLHGAVDRAPDLATVERVSGKLVHVKLERVEIEADLPRGDGA